jgi:cytochrome c553
MHAFPPNGGNVAVSNHGNGAGSNANAASEQGAQTIQGSTGASHATPKAASGGNAQNAWLGRCSPSTEGATGNELNPELFPRLLSAQEKKLEREAEHFSLSQRKEEARAARKAAKLTDFRFHDLRHTTASYLAMNSATLVEIAGVLGHRDLNTVRRYAHLSDSHLADKVESMNRRFINGK